MLDVDGAGGAGVHNRGAITKLTNSGAIGGGESGGGGGAGISNSGASATIGTLTNKSGGTISGGAATPGDAIFSEGGGLPAIANSGSIVGDIDVKDQSVTVTGGSGATFGGLTGGTINIKNGNLTFAGGNTALGDNIEVNGGSGTVYNSDPLQIIGPIAITGNYDQSGSGELDFLLLTTTDRTQYQLSVSGSGALDGVLDTAFGSGALVAGETFDIVTAGDLSGDFSGFAVSGRACSTEGGGLWRCGHNVSFDLNVMDGAGGVVDLTVSGVPEPATWVMLGAGFLGLGALRLRKTGAGARRGTG